MFQPAIPMTGYGGWKFLQTTYARQFETFSDSPAIKNDREYFTGKMSKPMAMEDFLSDKRLLRISLTAFDLEGEEWKGGFIRKVMEEANDAESSFLTRLNNPDYTKFSKAFPVQDGKITLTPEAVSDIGDNFESAAFRSAVGNVDNNMRLSLNYQNKIVEIAGSGASEEAILYRILGNVPVKNVLETALNLPSEMGKLDIEQQADILRDKLQSHLGITDVSQLASLDKVDDALKRFHAMNSINSGPSPTTPGYAALTLLRGADGFGNMASQNLFLSNL
ncbi:DUF1217 domain-containing protein [Henriciella aquimarina]|uniref:DUF1217 domain-containing protein n=1 Tax=Henriciella aquimarina TaxID=545261 RepID=UPI0009FD8DAB|nr:DUF1217 domain-containing protein [Henriciella aquimarina]